MRLEKMRIGRPASTRTERSRGQSMIEFALVAPTFFLIIFGIVEFGLMMFDVASSRYAAGESARAEAYAGNTTQVCSDVPGCTRLHPAVYSCDADCQALTAINNTALGTTKLITVNFIDIRRYTCSAAGVCTPTTSFGATMTSGSSCPPASCVRYKLDHSCYPGGGAAPCGGSPLAYPPSGRSTTYATPEYLGVTINYTYKWLTSIMSSIAASPTFNASFVIRVEPQKF